MTKGNLHSANSTNGFMRTAFNPNTYENSKESLLTNPNLNGENEYRYRIKSS